MKRKLVMLLTIVAVLAVGIGIWYNVPINLMDLEHDEVIEIVVFNGMILSILVDTFISKISFPMQPGPEIGSISDA